MMADYPRNWFTTTELPPLAASLLNEVMACDVQPRVLSNPLQQSHSLTDEETSLSTRNPTIVHERNARHAFLTGTRRALGTFCPGHEQALSQSLGERPLKLGMFCHRNLMPLGPLCTARHLTSLAVDPELPLPAFDTCTCASTILHSIVLRGPHDCSGCAITHISHRRKHHLKKARRDNPSRLICGCECEDVLPGDKEKLRLCIGCGGLVSVPLHGLDGTTHLVATNKGPSYEAGEGEGVGEGEGEASTRTTQCTAGHPIGREFLIPTPGYEVFQLGGNFDDDEQRRERIFRVGRSWLRPIGPGATDTDAVDVNVGGLHIHDSVVSITPVVEQTVVDQRRDSVASMAVDAFSSMQWHMSSHALPHAHPPCYEHIDVDMVDRDDDH
jgi:hypothetical protein